VTTYGGILAEIKVKCHCCPFRPGWSTCRKAGWEDVSTRDWMSSWCGIGMPWGLASLRAARQCRWQFQRQGKMLSVDSRREIAV